MFQWKLLRLLNYSISSGAHTLGCDKLTRQLTSQPRDDVPPQKIEKANETAVFGPRCEARQMLHLFFLIFDDNIVLLVISRVPRHEWIYKIHFDVWQFSIGAEEAMKVVLISLALVAAAVAAKVDFTG